MDLNQSLLRASISGVREASIFVQKPSFDKKSDLHPYLLPLHLGTVLALFLLLPFSKMVHGFFRLSALIIEEQKKESLKANPALAAAKPALAG